MLVAEIICAELARRLDLRTPEVKLIELDPQIAVREPDYEIQELLKASEGLNLAVDFLPGALGFEPLTWTPDPLFASRLVWFDGLIHNVDRSWRNPNLLVWHGDVWLIDHGAALWFHHNWKNADPHRPFDASDHVMAPFATENGSMADRITRELLDEVTSKVPDEWLDDEPGFDTAQAVRQAYAEHLLERAHSGWQYKNGKPDEHRGPGSIGAFHKGS